MLNDNGFRYLLFGLSLCSNLPIPGLTPSNGDAAAAIHIHLRVVPPLDDGGVRGARELSYTSAFLGPSGEPALRIWKVAAGAYLHLAYFDGMEFWLDREGNHIWALWPDEASLEEASTYILGPVIGLLLRLRGVTCLHASAVVIGGRAVVFVGTAGAGKSTTAAALGTRGCPVLSDDIVALSEVGGGFQVMPAYPYLSLWPEAVEMLYGSPEALPRFTGSWDKRFLANGRGGVRFQEEPIELGAVFILDNRRGKPAPYIQPLPPQSALMALVTNTYATNTLDTRMRAMEFEVLGRLSSVVRIRKVCAHEDPSMIDGLCKLILEDL